MNFLKDIGGAIFEDEPSHSAPAPQPPQAQAAAPAVALPTSPAYAPAPTTAETADHADDAYRKLLANTDFTASPAFQSLNKYLAPLASSGLDDKTKFGIAIKQAAAIDGLDPSSILALFDGFKDTLTQMADTFSKVIVAHTASDVDAKKAQATDLQAQATQLNEDAFNAQQKLQQSQHRFDVALQTRQAELAQEQAKYASFLG